MKKKFIIAALLAGIVAATCLTGYTCNGNGGEEQEQQQSEKGEKVTAEEWAAAINAMSDIKNYSINTWDIDTITVTGNYKGYDDFPVNLKSKSSFNGNAFYDFENVIEHMTASQTEIVSGFADLYSLEYFDGDWFYQFKWSLPYEFWDAEDKEESINSDDYTLKIDEKVYNADKSDASIWSVRESEFDSNALINIVESQLATEENGEIKTLAELYEAFTYSDGVYTANLWFGGTAMFLWSISFDGGCVSSVSMQTLESKVEERDGLTITRVYEGCEKIYDIGKTTVTPAPEAVKAVEDYIKEHS